jgi:hypothetical protein
MPRNYLCRHAIAFGLCTICSGLPVMKPLLETPPENVVTMIGTNQAIPEPDNPNDPAGGLFFQQPIQSFVSTTSTVDQAFISTISGLRPFKLK